MQLSATAFRGSAVAESGIKEIRAYVAARGEQKARRAANAQAWSAEGQRQMAWIWPQEGHGQ